MSQAQATTIGFVAILLWALLAAFTAFAGQVPPFQLTSMAFAISGLLGGVRILMKPTRLRHFRQPPQVWALGVGGLFGYHCLYFLALQSAPAVEASLIAYLWPLLIVVLSAALPGEVLRLRHVIGASMGFLGAGLIVTDGGSVGFRSEFAFGYVIALIAALTWSSYSVLSRLFSGVSTEIVTGFCAVTALFAAVCHGLFETTTWPDRRIAWLAILGLGLGPVGFAFFAWDIGVKHGNIQALGAMSYFAPLLSTLFLIVVGLAEPGPVLMIACVLISLGAVVASWRMPR